MNNTLANTTEVTTKSQCQTNGRSTYIRPVANISETAEGYLLEAELPGVSKAGLEITVQDGELHIVGRRAVNESCGQRVYRESRAGDFRRSFELDSSIDSSRITAKLENGLLQLSLPKAESVKPRKIELGD